MDTHTWKDRLYIDTGPRFSARSKYLAHSSHHVVFCIWLVDIGRFYQYLLGSFYLHWRNEKCVYMYHTNTIDYRYTVVVQYLTVYETTTNIN